MAVGAVAGDNHTVSPALGVLSTVKAAELPGKASELVVKAEAKNLKQTTIDVVKAAVGLNPAAAPAIVGSIAQASPAMAATACATAVALVPDQELLIARAAAAACPAKAGAIVEAICAVWPADYQKVAEAVAEVVPGAAKQILAGVSTAIPGLKNTIDQTLASYQGAIPSVSTVLTQVSQNQPLAAVTPVFSGNQSAPKPGLLPAPSPSSPTVHGPSTGNPIVTPPSTPPNTITPGSGGVIPTGAGRGYAAP